MPKELSQTKEANKPYSELSNTLRKMVDNPCNEYKIDDLKQVCKDIGLIHKEDDPDNHIFRSPHLEGRMTVQKNFYIIPNCIKRFVGLAVAHIDASGGHNG